MEPLLQLREDVDDYLKQSYCNTQICSILGEEECEKRYMKQLQFQTQPPLFSTLRVNTLTTTLEQAHGQLQNVLDEKNQAAGRDKLQVEISKSIPDLLIVQHTGPHERDQSLPEVVVGLACGMAVLRGADVFSPGILGAPAYLQKGDLVSVYADVDGKCLRGYMKPFEGHKLFVGNGIMQVGRSDVFCAEEKLGGIGIAMTQPLYNAPSLSDLMTDVIFAQNLPSTVCGHLLNPQPGEVVLDMCAAPGGKTTHIATLMRNQGTVIALDKSKNKIPGVEKNLRRLGLTNVRVYGSDSTKAHSIEADLSGPPPYPSECFDRILLDAPCSALGQRPCLKNTMKLAEIKSFPVLQRTLIVTAVRLLKLGGTLVYSTCSLPIEENECQVHWTLDHFPELTLEAPNDMIGSAGLPGSELTPSQLKALQRFGLESECSPPTPTTDTIGFFCAKFVKKK